MPAPTTGLTTVKAFTYRGKAGEEWSNHYWFSGATPADAAAWRALFDALVVEEKKVLPAWHTIVGGYGYNTTADNRHAVYSIDLTVSPNTPVAGTHTSTRNVAPGDAAMWVRWGLDRLTGKGKRIYLRKYFHGAYIEPGGDLLDTTQLTKLNAFGEKLRDGSFLAGRITTDTLGSALVGTASSQYVTTRTLKRRSKRKPPT